MVIADRLRALREEKQLSQGDIEKRTGLLRCYISRVENGHNGPGHRNSGENGPRNGNSHVPAFLRWGEATRAAESSKAEVI